jgi:hypothetical protein
MGQRTEVVLMSEVPWGSVTEDVPMPEMERGGGADADAMARHLRLSRVIGVDLAAVLLPGADWTPTKVAAEACKGGDGASG